mgnify:CR=1 FL=1
MIASATAPSSVAPLAGAWVEIGSYKYPKSINIVAPLAGAWVEIVKRTQRPLQTKVAPLAGAWVEIETL